MPSTVNRSSSPTSRWWLVSSSTFRTWARDTNVIVAALIQKGIVRELLLGHPDVFVTPEECIREVRENREIGIGGGCPMP